MKRYIHCEQEVEVRSSTRGVRGPNFPLHPSEEAGRWPTGLLFYLQLYSNQGMYSVPDSLKPNHSEGFTQQHLLFPRGSRGNLVQGELKLSFLFFLIHCIRMLRKLAKRESRLQIIRCEYWIFFFKEGGNLAPYIGNIF